MDEEPLLGGNVAPVVRVGDTVRRVRGPWTDAVHELLTYLEKVGFAYSPRVLGFDEKGREVLSYIEGDTAGPTHPWPDWVWADTTLTQVAAIMREYHDAVRGFRPKGERVWRFARGALGADEIVCHNDIAPYNIVHRDGRVVGIIDWDVAGPAAPIWDVALTAWALAPIHAPEHSRALGAPRDIGRRLRLLCDDYGLEHRDALLHTIDQRIAASIEGIHTMADQGEGAFQTMLAEGHADRMQEDSEQLALCAAEWQRILRAF